MKKILFLLSLISIDQFTKYLVLKNFLIGESLNLLPILDIYLILNTGIAFSLFDDGEDLGRWLLVLLVLLVCLYLFYILVTESLDRYESLALLMILSGGVGNLSHLVDGIKLGGASAVLAASIFHFGEYTIEEAKKYLKSAGIPVRI